MKEPTVVLWTRVPIALASQAQERASTRSITIAELLREALDVSCNASVMIAAGKQLARKLAPKRTRRAKGGAK